MPVFARVMQILEATSKNEYNIVPNTAHRLITWVRDTLIKSGEFRLPGKRSLAADPPATVWIDATECETERQKKQRRTYSGKEKRYTNKL